MLDIDSKIYVLTEKRNTQPWNNIENDNIPIKSPIQLVYSLKTKNGIGEFNEFQYKYHDYIYNKFRGIKGFRYIITYNMQTKLASGVFYEQIKLPNGKGFQYYGLPTYSYAGRAFQGSGSSKQLDSWGKWLTETDIEYSDVSDRKKIYEPYTTVNKKTFYDPNSKAFIKSIYHYNYLSKDGLGNIVKTVDKTYDNINKKNFYKTTYNSYDAEDKEKWYIGRVTKSTVVHTQSDGHSVTRVATFKYNSHGLLSQEVKNAGTSLALTKNYSYDSRGNKIKETISGYGIQTATTSYNYDSLGKFLKRVTNPAGLTKSYTYDPRFGTVASVTDANGLTIKWRYDSLGRKIEELRPDGTRTSWEHIWSDGSTIGASHTLYSVGIDTTGKPSTRTYYDMLGREVGSYTYSISKGSRTSYKDRRIIKRKYYNAKGELIKEELPHYQNSSAKAITKIYDKYGRVVKVTKPGPQGKTQTYSTSYKNFTTTITDPKGVKKVIVKNAIDQTIKVIDAYGTSNASQIAYKYDAIGNLIETRDSLDSVVKMEYDEAGNKKYTNDPDLGVWNYRYNASGQLKYQWSGIKGYQESEHATYKIYDILGRVIKEKTFNHKEFNTDSKKYSYNYLEYSYGDTKAKAGSRGKLVKAYASSKVKGKDWNGELQTITYDSLGRVIKSNTHIYNRGDYPTTTTYDQYSRPSRITYPNGYSITNHYNKGILDKITDKYGKIIYEINSFNAFGKIESARYGNGVENFNGYDSAGYLETIASGKTSALFANIQRVDYTYDILGNVVTREDNSIPNKTITDRFTYDSMNRLTSFSVSSDVVGNYAKYKRYSYDRLGNITYQSGIGYYHYDSSKHHRLLSAGSRRYSYDEVGNIINRNGDTITYNPINKPSTLTDHKSGTKVTFVYGIDGKRYFKRTSNNQYTFYIGKAYEEQIEDEIEKQICYISVAGKVVATHEEIKDTRYDPSNKYYNIKSYNHYFHSDALGSITAITDDNAKVVERRSYEPFGKIRAMAYGVIDTKTITPVNSVLKTTRAFTGHEQIAEINGLIHMNARVYDSDIGRFLAADSVIQDTSDSQAYNRYAYARNNPMHYIDPSGNSWIDDFFDGIFKIIDSIGAVIVGAVIAAVAPYLLPGALGLFGTAVVTGALVGFASGAIATGTLKGALKGAFWGAISAGVAYGVAELASTITGVTSDVAHAASLIKAGLNKVTAIKSLLHGLSRGIIAKLQGGSFRAGFFSGLSSALDIGTVGYGTIVGRTVIMAVVGGTASVLGGGKFANGAMSGAFVHLFNAEMEHDRQELLLKRARAILADPKNLPAKYISTLKRMIDDGRLLYEKNYMRTVTLPDGTSGLRSVYGTADIKTGTIRITSLIWHNWNAKGLPYDDLIGQIDYDIIHELQHIMIHSALHPPTFETNINNWGWRRRF